MQHEPALSTLNAEFEDKSPKTSQEKSNKKMLKIILMGLFALVLIGALFSFSPTKQKSIQNRIQSTSSVLADTTCARGSYVSARRCHTCPAGHFCMNNRKTQCPAGTFQPHSGKWICISSGCGHYVPAPGSSLRHVCRSGTYASGSRNSRCVPTPAGQFSKIRACRPTKCPKGTYQDCRGQSSCRRAPCGHYVSSIGATRYIPCPAGSYQPADGAVHCHVTKPGTYAKVGYCAARKCSPGWYQPKPRKAYCMPASCGHYVTKAGAIRQILCRVLYYQPERAQPACLRLPTGYVYNPKNNRCAIKKSPPGSPPDITGNPTPAPCGHYSHKGDAHARKCPAGYYQNKKGQSTCHKAPPGTYPSPNRCALTKCKPGTFQNQWAQTKCLPAKCGHMAPNHGMSKPKRCPPGYYQNNVGQTKCLKCSVGRYQPKYAQCQCLACAQGKYQPNSGQSRCHNCPCGKYAPSIGMVGCKKCAAGSYQPHVGQKSCIKAPPGRYAKGGGCKATPCSAGFYTGISGMSSCTQSKCGHKVSAVGQTKATPCLPGTYQPLTGQTRCLPAPKGSYTNQRGQCKETLCAVGHFQPHPRRTSCPPANCGHFVAVRGSEYQNPCGAGRWQDRKGQSTCKTATKGHYAPGFAKCKQVQCPPGHFTDCNGQDRCVPAACGSYAPRAGSQSSRPCPAGTYQNAPGQRACKQTPRGRFSKVGWCFPNFCDPGTYQNKGGKSSCIPSKCGHYVDYEGAVVPRRCPASTYQPNMGQTGCLSTTLKLAPSPGTCKRGGGSRKFYLSRGTGTYATKKAACAATGGQLASIHNAADNAAVVAVCPRGKTCWIGAKLVAGKWLWQDGTPVKYFNWQRGEPNGRGKEDCIQFYAFPGGSNGKWNDLRCIGTMEAVCEKRVAKPSTSVSGAWTLVARQTVSSGFFPRSVVSTGKFNAHNPRAGNYMNLGLIEQHRRNGAFEFKLVWPKSTRFSKSQIWRQTSNPWLSSQRKVRGYRAVSVPYTQYHWGGLEWNGHHCVLDGSAHHGWWFYAVGSFGSWGGGIPGPTAVVKHVELYVRR